MVGETTFTTAEMLTNGVRKSNAAHSRRLDVPSAGVIRISFYPRLAGALRRKRNHIFALPTGFDLGKIMRRGLGNLNHRV